MLRSSQAEVDLLLDALDRVQNLSRLLRHKGASFAGPHVADLIDRALIGGGVSQ